MAKKTKDQAAGADNYNPEPLIEINGVVLNLFQVIRYKPNIGEVESKGRLLNAKTINGDSVWLRIKDGYTDAEDWVSVNVQLDYFTIEQMVDVK